MSLLGIILAIMIALVLFRHYVWPRLPILPGLFEDMNNGYSYDREGNRLEDSR